MSPIVYIANNFRNANDMGAFTREWQALNEKDKETLKKWAEEEMKVLNIV